MTADRLKAGNELIGRRCQAGCGKTLRAGQVVLAHRVGSLSWDKNLIGAHARCVAGVLASAPEELDDFDAVRARLAAGGPLFEDLDLMSA